MMRVTLLAGFALAVSGCQQTEHDAPKPESEIARYHMMPNPGGEGFILLDTKTGFARHCDVKPPQVACGKIAYIPDI